MIQKLFRENLKNFKSYSVGKEKYKVKLDANENPFNLVDEIKDEIKDKIENIDFNRYPDSEAEEVSVAFAKYVKVSRKNIIAGNGSDELIQMITNVFLNEEDKIMMLDPDFSMYKVYTEIRGGKVIKFGFDDNFDLNVDKLIYTVNKEKVKVLIFSNPNNPLGMAISRDKIIKIIENCNCIVIVDEAYVEFYGNSVINEINNYENLIVLRTCSKALGVAALRLGFLVTNKKLLEEIKKVKPPFNVNSISQAIGSVVLKNKKFIENNIIKILQERKFIYDELIKIKDIKVYYSEANFILIKFKNLIKVYEGLLKAGIIVRRFKEGILKDCLRISVGRREENEYFLKVIKNLI